MRSQHGLLFMQSVLGWGAKSLVGTVSTSQVAYHALRFLSANKNILSRLALILPLVNQLNACKAGNYGVWC